MKTLKYIFVVCLVSLMLGSCYEDKGSYNNKDWTDIVSVSGVQFVGSSYGRVTILEGDVLTMNPEIKFKEGVDPADFEYHWLMGGDTIAEGKNLAWTITPTNIQVLSGEAYFWLAIHNKKTGEAWKHYAVDISGTYSYMVKVKISPTAMPFIGVIIYEKSDQTLEWASVKGANKNRPQDFSTIFTEMYKRYNPDRVIKGPFAGAALDIPQLFIYTNDPDSYGVGVQTNSGATYPFGMHIGTMKDVSFMGTAPAQPVKAKNTYYGNLQEIMVGTELFLLNHDGTNYPYQIINPNQAGTQSDVAQIMASLPYLRNCPVNLQRRTNGEIYHYSFSVQTGYKYVALPDGNSGTLTADQIVGVFREPTDVTSDAARKMWVIVRQGTVYNMYVYTIQHFSGNPSQILFIEKRDVSAWAGGATGNMIWFTTVCPIGWNYAYIAKGKDLWRYSFEDLGTPPVIVRSFPDEIVWVNPVSDAMLISGVASELYGAIFTYNQSSDNSTMYVVNLRSENVDDISTISDKIPGKVLRYLPYYTN